MGRSYPPNHAALTRMAGPGTRARRHDRRGCRAGDGCRKLCYVRDARGARSLAGGEAIAAQELPGARDVQDVRVLAHLHGERRERRGEVDDAHGGIVQYLVTRGVAHFDRDEAAVGPQGDVQHEAAREVLTPRLFRVIEIADALDLLAPRLEIGRVAEGAGLRGNDALARPFAVGLEGLIDLGFDARDLFAAHHELRRRGLIRLRVALCLFGVNGRRIAGLARDDRGRRRHLQGRRLFRRAHDVAAAVDGQRRGGRRRRRGQRLGEEGGEGRGGGEGGEEGGWGGGGGWGVWGWWGGSGGLSC